ncbi:uncharacterized protein LOC126063196 [Elephas maximus indicus]|uniref:uncharacterized protein LOC126063196 n=1 Tax=Elephas maximus indicus TaxID=99487 RepID=UPI002115DE3A|nr:uncharacterized protein LOC126063196 [Elephas maximus indicus]
MAFDPSILPTRWAEGLEQRPQDQAQAGGMELTPQRCPGPVTGSERPVPHCGPDIRQSRHEPSACPHRGSEASALPFAPSWGGLWGHRATARPAPYSGASPGSQQPASPGSLPASTALQESSELSMRVHTPQSLSLEGFPSRTFSLQHPGLARYTPRLCLNYNSQHAAGRSRPAEARTTTPSMPRDALALPKSVVPRSWKLGRSDPAAAAAFAGRGPQPPPEWEASHCPAMLRGLARAAAQRHGAPWARGSGGRAGVPAHVVDLCGDTVTSPGPAMRRTMAEVVVGATTMARTPPSAGSPACKSFRKRPRSCSGWSRPCLCPPTPWPTSSQIAGVHSHPLPDLPHGTMDLVELERCSGRAWGTPTTPSVSLLAWRTPTAAQGSELDYLRQVHALARNYGVRVHLDGALLLNAVVALRVPPTCIMEHCDSVSLCFSKDLHPGLQELVSSLCSVDPSTMKTNVVMVQVAGLPPEKLCQHLRPVSAEEEAQMGQAVSVLLFPWTECSVRAMWHCDVSARDTELALRKWEFVLRQVGP